MPALQCGRMRDKEEAMTDDFDIGDILDGVGDIVEDLPPKALLVLLVIAGIIGLIWYLS
jgi:hypothetical protein